MQHDIFKRKVLADDFSLYLHRPTETDPSLAPEGCDTFYALAPVPHLDASVDWLTYAETFKERILAHAARSDIVHNSMIHDPFWGKEMPGILKSLHDHFDKKRSSKKRVKTA